MSVLTGREDRALGVRGHEHADHPVGTAQLDPPHAVGLTTHGPRRRLVEADGLAARRGEQDGVAGSRHADAHEPIVLVELDGPDARGARTRVRLEAGFLDHALAGREEDRPLVVERAHAQHRVDRLLALDRQEVRHGTTLGRA